MNRLVECKSYKLREDLERMMSPWSLKPQSMRTLSDLEVGQHGVNLPRAIPTVKSPELDKDNWNISRLKTHFIPEGAFAGMNELSRTKEVVEEGMKVLEGKELLQDVNPFYGIPVYQEEPDEDWALLKSEIEARYKLDAFRERLELHFAQYKRAQGKTKRKAEPIPEVEPPRKEQVVKPYYDKRCEDKRKMIPRVYSAPPYPHYWLRKPLKKNVSIDKEKRASNDKI